MAHQRTRASPACTPPYSPNPAAAGWAVVDVGSANGTTLNDDPTALSPNVPRPVAAGDRIHVGAWTTITLRTT
uniref:FHA domain-containing protein n=1 Tax=Fodinicola feengrottensis TaxID=435914 RepID=UPI0036F1EE15